MEVSILKKCDFEDMKKLFLDVFWIYVKKLDTRNGEFFKFLPRSACFPLC
ncbi:hypothetical protein GCM10011409_45620 [Lentibacillus populi]|uniref:Uncharacterized protein n=1 Tax=Lentibacillus populi TaxID=1827502 RepID=A0A9W5U2U6_9BACI|nr:hypothetical protein GCM10011409_45620 [Lentibacillus populi]